MKYTLNDLVDTFVEACLEVKNIIQIDIEIHETPNDFVCMILCVLGKNQTGICIGTGKNDDNYLIVDWEQHEKVINMFKERMGITTEDEESCFFNVIY
jgi:hypothetical protein